MVALAAPARAQWTESSGQTSVMFGLGATNVFCAPCLQSGLYPAAHFAVRFRVSASGWIGLSYAYAGKPRAPDGWSDVPVGFIEGAYAPANSPARLVVGLGVVASNVDSVYTYGSGEYTYGSPNAVRGSGLGAKLGLEFTGEALDARRFVPFVNAYVTLANQESLPQLWLLHAGVAVRIK